MKISFVSYKISHLFALFVAFAVHAGIVVVSLLPSSPIVLNNQVINVSFVAPNSQNSRSENFSHKKNLIALEKENSLKSKEILQEAQDEKQKSFSGKETSGRVDPNAVATHSAESEPVFDAEYLNNPAPRYPLAAKRHKIEGKVFLSVTVKTDGTAGSVEISRSSGSDILDGAALEAVKQWHFIPAKRSGQLVQAQVIVPIEFKIT
jgi:TonB family protein